MHEKFHAFSSYPYYGLLMVLIM